MSASPSVTPGPDGRLATDVVDTFATAAVTSFEEHLSGMPEGSVSLVLPAAGHVVTTPGTQQGVGPFARPSRRPCVGRDGVRGHGPGRRRGRPPTP